MGLKLRLNLFHGVKSVDVHGAFISFYVERRLPLQETGDAFRAIEFHEEHQNWVVVSLDGGWEWKVRREAQLFVSQALRCAGFLIFVYDGNYWGYEFFDRGVTLDHFVQHTGSDAPIGFPGHDCRGNPQIVAEPLGLRTDDVAPYLVQFHDWEKPAGVNLPARAGDEFRRFDECAVLDFLRMLGVGVKLADGCVRIQSPRSRLGFTQ